MTFLSKTACVYLTEHELLLKKRLKHEEAISNSKEQGNDAPALGSSEMWTDDESWKPSTGL